jgi:hypothetical protein
VGPPILRFTAKSAPATTEVTPNRSIVRLVSLPEPVTAWESDNEWVITARSIAICGTAADVEAVAGTTNWSVATIDIGRRAHAASQQAAVARITTDCPIQ